jgi:D-beta-D-heptose 7-phosphate kinase/D-beta-D-heptose 1-phosphate adenosyltransferase
VSIAPSALARQPVAIIGDVMLDHFLIGRVDRISPEAPVPVVRYERDEFRLGGAANVAHNVTALGGVARLVGLVGHDEAATRLRHGLQAAGIAHDGLVTDDGRPTTQKLRVVTSRNQQVARIDYETDAEPAAAAAARLAEAVATAARGARALVLSDYRKGVASRAVLSAAIAAARDARAPLLVDPKVMQAEWYQGATLITPNHHEAALMTQAPVQTDDDARRAARVLHERTGANVIITRGDHGMWILDASSPSHIEVALPAATHEVADVTGAGDTVIAVLALALAAGAALADAARLANIAAGLVVTRFGPVAVTLDELTAAATAQLPHHARSH